MLDHCQGGFVRLRVIPPPHLFRHTPSPWRLRDALQMPAAREEPRSQGRSRANSEAGDGHSVGGGGAGGLPAAEVLSDLSDDDAAAMLVGESEVAVRMQLWESMHGEFMKRMAKKRADRGIGDGQGSVHSKSTRSVARSGGLHRPVGSGAEAVAKVAATRRAGRHIGDVVGSIDARQLFDAAPASKAGSVAASRSRGGPASVASETGRKRSRPGGSGALTEVEEDYKRGGSVVTAGGRSGAGGDDDEARPELGDSDGEDVQPPAPAKRMRYPKTQRVVAAPASRVDAAGAGSRPVLSDTESESGDQQADPPRPALAPSAAPARKGGAAAPPPPPALVSSAPLRKSAAKPAAAAPPAVSGGVRGGTGKPGAGVKAAAKTGAGAPIARPVAIARPIAAVRSSAATHGDGDGDGDDGMGVAGGGDGMGEDALLAADTLEAGDDYERGGGGDGDD
jgi:hypothetical protein